MTISPQGTARGGLWKDVAVPNLTGTTAETALVTTTISGGTMNSTNKLTFLVGGGLSTAALTPGTLTFKVKYGSFTATVTSGALALIGGASDSPYKLLGYLTNKATTGAQYLQIQFTNTSGGLTLTNGISLGHARPTIDSTSDQTFSITAQFSNGSTSNILAVDYLEVTVNS